MDRDGFCRALLAWYDREKRELPWRGTQDPDRVWLSEIMLQQTRAEAVAPRYEAFLTRFPTVAALAAADEEAVLKAWEGMGYYSRARNLRRSAMEVVRRGGFPRSAKEWQKLPGVGAYTAAAVASIAYLRRRRRWTAIRRGCSPACWPLKARWIRRSGCERRRRRSSTASGRGTTIRR